MYKALKGGGRSTLTQQRHRDRCQELHRKRLRGIKSNIDNKAPRRHNHLRRNLKKEQMLEGASSAPPRCAAGGAAKIARCVLRAPPPAPRAARVARQRPRRTSKPRRARNSHHPHHAHRPTNPLSLPPLAERYARIERENRLLLEKMAGIMLKNTLDNRCESISYSHSLNKASRKRDLLRITRENARILHGIQTREPTYNHVKWEQERKVQEQYLRNISFFENPWDKDEEGEYDGEEGYDYEDYGDDDYEEGGAAGGGAADSRRSGLARAGQSLMAGT